VSGLETFSDIGASAAHVAEWTHTVDKLGNVQRTSSNGIDPLRISSTTS